MALTMCLSLCPRRLLLAGLLSLAVLFAFANFTGVGLGGVEPEGIYAAAQRSLRSGGTYEELPASGVGDVLLQAASSVHRGSAGAALLETPPLLVENGSALPFAAARGAQDDASVQATGRSSSSSSSRSSSSSNSSSFATSLLGNTLEAVPNRVRIGLSSWSLAGVAAPVPHGEHAKMRTGTSAYLDRIHASSWYLLVYVLLVLAAALAYRACKSSATASRDPDFVRRIEGGFDASICDCAGCCGEDWLLCFCSFCCLGLRWSENFDAGRRGGASFWGALVLSTVCFSLSGILFDSVGICCYLVFVLLAVCARQRLRVAVGLEAGSAKTLAEDCVAWSCFCCCAGAQEARQVDHYMAKS